MSAARAGKVMLDGMVVGRYVLDGEGEKASQPVAEAVPRVVLADAAIPAMPLPPLAVPAWWLSSTAGLTAAELAAMFSPAAPFVAGAAISANELAFSQVASGRATGLRSGHDTDDPARTLPADKICGDGKLLQASLATPLPAAPDAGKDANIEEAGWRRFLLLGMVWLGLAQNLSHSPPVIEPLEDIPAVVIPGKKQEDEP